MLSIPTPEILVFRTDMCVNTAALGFAVAAVTQKARGRNDNGWIWLFFETIHPLTS